MAPKERQKIEIEKTHRDPLLSFNQAVTVDCSDFLGTALIQDRQKPRKTWIDQNTLGAYLAMQVQYSRFLASLYLKAPEVTRRNTRAQFIQPLRERIVREVGYELARRSLGYKSCQMNANQD
jgi:hypothetical protein